MLNQIDFTVKIIITTILSLTTLATNIITSAQDITENQVDFDSCNGNLDFEFPEILKIINNSETIISIYNHDFNFNHDFSNNPKEGINFVDAKEFNLHQETSFCEVEQLLFLNK